MAEPFLQRRILLLAIILLAIPIGSVILQQFLLDHASSSTQPPVANAVSTARVSFCLNQPPTPSVGTCAANATQNTTYTCQLNLSDPDGGTVTVDQFFVQGGATILNITSNGSIGFTPTDEDVGNYTILSLIQDDSGCVNANVNLTYFLNVININDPPRIVRTIPDVTLTVNTTLYPFFLVDHYVDPDEDVMNFTSTIPTGVTLTIDSSSRVSLTAQECDTSALVVFTATDPYNASTDSGIVTITVDCPTGGDGSGDETGAGGGGGGGAALCRSNWECDEWFACLPSGTQWQRCYDTKGCDVDRYLQRDCVYTGENLTCQENWLCGPWSSCAVNGTQERACEDLIACGTTVLRPPLTQECVYLATCFDGIQNGDETGVDCGGSCGVCPNTEQPSLIAQRIGWFLLILLLGLLIAGGAAGYYRAAIARMSAMLGFLVRHRVAKDLLLDAAQRRSLFERIRVFELRPRDADPLTRYDALGELTRSYFAEALALPLEATADEVRGRMLALGLRHESRLLLDGLLGKLAIIEGEELVDDPLFFQASIEELRTAVCLTSAYELTEIERPLEEYPVTDGMSFYDEIFARMIVTLRAVQFGQLEAARTQYLELLSRYDPLPPAEQEQIYPELRWLFDVTRLASEAVGGRLIDKSRFAET